MKSDAEKHVEEDVSLEGVKRLDLNGLPEEYRIRLIKELSQMADKYPEAVRIAINNLRSTFN